MGKPRHMEIMEHAQGHYLGCSRDSMLSNFFVLLNITLITLSPEPQICLSDLCGFKLTMSEPTQMNSEPWSLSSNLYALHRTTLHEKPQSHCRHSTGIKTSSPGRRRGWTKAQVVTFYRSIWGAAVEFRTRLPSCRSQNGARADDHTEFPGENRPREKQGQARYRPETLPQRKLWENSPRCPSFHFSWWSGPTLLASVSFGVIGILWPSLSCGRPGSFFSPPHTSHTSFIHSFVHPKIAKFCS